MLPTAEGLQQRLGRDAEQDPGAVEIDDPTVLERIAAGGQGTSVKGDAATIVQVYRDLSTFF